MGGNLDTRIITRLSLELSTILCKMCTTFKERNFVDSSSCHYLAPVGEHRALVVRVQGRGGALLAAEGEAALVAHHGRGGVQQGEAGEAARHGVLNTGRWRTTVTAV